jgi:hypothetical protein
MNRTESNNGRQAVTSRRSTMLSRKLLLPVVVAAFASCLSASPLAQGTLPDQPVYFTFSAPVTLPGTTLPAGQYEFKLSSSQADRHIVQVYSRDNQKYVGMFFAIPAMRPSPPDKAEVTFMETPSNMPPAVQTWWYPGITTGHEFIYPREQAVILAKSSTKGVMTTEGDVKSGKLTRLTSSAPAAAPEPVVAPAPAPMAMAEAQAAPPAPRRVLPKTASDLPIISAAGMLSLLAGVALARRRVA